MKEYKNNYGGVEEDLSAEAVIGFFAVGITILTIIIVLVTNL